MPRQYAWEEAIIRIYRIIRGDTISANVEELDGNVTSYNEALSAIAEILQASGNENFHLPIPLRLHPVSSAPTGTALGYLGGNLYALNGALYWYGSSGTITTIAGS